MDSVPKYKVLPLRNKGVWNQVGEMLLLALNLPFEASLKGARRKGSAPTFLSPEGLC